MLIGILLTFHIIVCIALIGVVLIQRSEGGALGMGGGPSGFMTARGAGDLLTRATWILGSIFFILSLTLTLLTARSQGEGSIVDRLKVQSIDPRTLNQPPPKEQAPAQPAPLQAPTPQVRNPFLGEDDTASQQPASQQAPAKP
jgi:preprotein translocase subunit SecG